jgi:DNA-binding response OmpR family regulator
MRVLVVDDEPLIADGVGRYLKGKGYDTSVTTSPAEALSMIDKETFDIVITDLRMEPVSGIGIIRRLKDLVFSGKIIVISAYERDYEQELKDLKVDAVIEKPFELGALMRAVQGSDGTK